MVDYSLYLVTDDELCAGDFFETVEAGIEGGISVVQLREKYLDTRPFYERALKLKEITRAAGIPLIINDRIDIALAAKADGVHIGQSDMPLEIASEILGPNAIIGVSVSTPEEARHAEIEGADYIAISPVWATPTKTDTPKAVGIEGSMEIAKSVEIPCIGIGGINNSNAAEVILAGCDGIAVVSAIMACASPKDSATELRKIIDKAKSERRRNG